MKLKDKFTKSKEIFNEKVCKLEQEHAVEIAKAEHKKLLIDISAPYCSICKAIDAKLLSDAQVQEK